MRGGPRKPAPQPRKPDPEPVGNDTLWDQPLEDRPKLSKRDDKDIELLSYTKQSVLKQRGRKYDRQIVVRKPVAPVGARQNFANPPQPKASPDKRPINAAAPPPSVSRASQGSWTSARASEVPTPTSGTLWDKPVTERDYAFDDADLPALKSGTVTVGDGREHTSEPPLFAANFRTVTPPPPSPKKEAILGWLNNVEPEHRAQQTPSPDAKEPLASWNGAENEKWADTYQSAEAKNNWNAGVRRPTEGKGTLQGVDGSGMDREERFAPSSKSGEGDVGLEKKQRRLSVKAWETGDVESFSSTSTSSLQPVHSESATEKIPHAPSTVQPAFVAHAPAKPGTPAAVATPAAPQIRKILLSAQITTPAKEKKLLQIFDGQDPKDQIRVFCEQNALLDRMDAVWQGIQPALKK
ncbi:hypothetical protein HK104_009606 [Borealophlyctis nickersoniae]|nr:hypothetical protein HK104_009606 [Borealophlyctis nickersoniae]